MPRIRTLFFALTLLLLAAVLPTAALADYEDDCADELNQLGLFLGTEAGYALDETPTRAQMAVMLTRLLGGEEEALDLDLPHPFTDTRPWLSPYLGWLTAAGLVNGTAADCFSPDDPCDADMYCAVLLRALGYSEQAGDFNYTGAAETALALGIAEWPLWEDGFTRGDLAILSRAALARPVAQGDTTLLAQLRERGAVAAEAGADFAAVLAAEAGRRTELTDTAYIMHAGGEINGYTLTNSLAALDLNYAAGRRCFEIDLSLTADGQVVCLHDWNSALLPGCDGEPLTLAQFEDARIYGLFPSTTLEQLLDWLETHPDTYLFLDMKADELDIYAQIAAQAGPLLERIVPQIYTFDEYAPLRAWGYDNVILTLYRLPGRISADAETLRDYALRHRLLGITFDKALLSPAYVRTLAESGVALFTHTVNLPEEQEYSLRLGVTGIYRDR